MLAWQPASQPTARSSENYGGRHGRGWNDGRKGEGASIGDFWAKRRRRRWRWRQLMRNKGMIRLKKELEKRGGERGGGCRRRRCRIRRDMSGWTDGRPDAHFKKVSTLPSLHSSRPGEICIMSMSRGFFGRRRRRERDSALFLPPLALHEVLTRHLGEFVPKRRLRRR